MITPNSIFFSRRLKEEYPHIARELTRILGRHGITPKWLDHTNDIWVRDFMPIQLNDTYFLHYTYYPDYLMRSLEDRASITNPIRLEQQLLVQQGKVVVYLPLILDGGNAVITDRHIIMTEKVLYENKRDKLSNKNAVSKQFRKKSKLEPLYLKWDAPGWNKQPMVEKYGHTDWLVRYIGGNTVIVAWNEEDTMSVSESAITALKEAGGYNIKDFKLEHPSKNSWAYLNYVQVNDIVLMPAVADPEAENDPNDPEAVNDAEAKRKLEEIFKAAGQDLIIEQINCHDLIPKGGALHCISWNPML